MESNLRQRKGPYFKLVIFLTLILTTVQIGALWDLEATHRFQAGDGLVLEELAHPLLPVVDLELKADQQILNFQGKLTSHLICNSRESGSVVMEDPGKVNLTMNLFGFIPVRRMEIEVVPAVTVVPGGHSIGVLMRGEGVVVVGYSPVAAQNGTEIYPAQEAGIEIGDLIVEINGQRVDSDQKAARLLQNSGEPVRVKIVRDGQSKNIKLRPVLDSEKNIYRIGLYIRDSAAGIGTLTFYDPATGKYGALGHRISDAEIDRQLKKGEGRIIEAAVEGIHAGRKGEPGEKVGVFFDQGRIAGEISANTTFGIFGELTGDVGNPIMDEVEVALTREVHPGPAKLLTVIEGSHIESFDLVIEKVMPYQKNEGKGMVIKITDPQLLEATGGIIQGMSGSPIIQDGKLAGAVTHVFINDPTRGYGVMAEWMLETCGVLVQEKIAS